MYILCIFVLIWKRKTFQIIVQVIAFSLTLTFAFATKLFFFSNLIHVSMFLSSRSFKGKLLLLRSLTKDLEREKYYS